MYNYTLCRLNREDVSKILEGVEFDLVPFIDVSEFWIYKLN